MSSNQIPAQEKFSYLHTLCAVFLAELSSYFKDGSKFAVIGHHPEIKDSALIVTDDAFESLSAVCLRMAAGSTEPSSPASTEKALELQYCGELLDDALDSIRHKFIAGTKFAVVVDNCVAGSSGTVFTEMGFARLRQIVSQHP